MQDDVKLWMYLIEMQVLLEDRLDFLRTNFHDRAASLLQAVTVPTRVIRAMGKQQGADEAAKFINFVISIDPDPQKKNSQWLLTAVMRKNHAMPLEDLLYATETLTKYAEMKQARQIPRERMDINTFRSLSELNAVMRGEQEQTVSADEAEQQEVMKEAEVLYDGPDARVLVPLTRRAACYFGRNTDWCTAWGDHLKLGLRQQGRYPTRGSSYFASYTGKGEKLFIIEIKPNGPLYQYSSEYNQFMDAKDVSLSGEAVRKLFKEHPNVMKAIGEDKFVKTHLHDLGASFFSPEALLRADPRVLLGSVKTIQDYYALPEQVQKRPETIAAILMTLPEVAKRLPKELMTPEVAAALRQAIAGGKPLDCNVLNAFQRFFSVAEWPSTVIRALIINRTITREQLAAATATEMMQPIFNMDRYSGFKMVMGAAPDTPVAAARDIFYLAVAKNGTSWFWFTARDGKLDKVGSQPSAAMDRGPLTSILLNAIGIPPEFDTELSLAENLKIFYGKEYGSLHDVGKPDIKAGDVTLFRLGSRHMWIGVSSNVSTHVTRLWMKGTTLFHDTTKYLGDDYTLAVRQLAIKYKARHVGGKNSDSAKYFGMINGKGRLYADFPSLMAYANTLPDLAYSGDDQKKRDFFEAILKWAGRLSRDEQETLYEILRSDQAKSQTTETQRIYDITIPHIEIHLPSSNRLMEQYGVINDKSILRKIAIDSQRAVRAAIQVVSAQTYADIHIPSLPRQANGLSKDSETLYQQIHALNAKTSEAVAERRRNPEQFAAQSDLSGRFAALNAFRKRY